MSSSPHLRGFARHVTLKRLLGVASSVLALVVGVTYVGSSRGANDVLWRGDYETQPQPWGDWKIQANPGDAVIEETTRRQGGFAAKFSVSPHDVPIGRSGERAQVYISQRLTNGYEGRDVWYAWSTLVAHGSVLDPGDWNDLTAWHQTGPVCPAPVHVAINGTTRMLRLDAWGGALNSKICSNPYRKTWALGKLRLGRWHDFVFHVKWSPDPAKGLVEMWIDGKHVLPPSHAATLYSGQGVYLKQGLDRGSARGTAVIFNDGTVVANSYAGAITAFPAGSWASASPRRAVGLTRTVRVIAEIGLAATALPLLALAVRDRQHAER